VSGYPPAVSLRAPAVRLLAPVAAFGAPIAFQLGGGIRDVGVVEEWGVYSYFDQAGVVFWAPIDKQLAPQSIRPLTVAPHSVAYLLDPDGFLGLQLVQALAMGLQGLGMLLLLRALRVGDALAVAGAVLFALFPAHDASFTLRSVHMHWALAFLVFALWLLVRLGDGALRPAPVAAMIACVGLSLLVYEAGYIAVALAPALLLVRARRLDRRRLVTLSALWYAAPFVNGLEIIRLLTSGQLLYQKAITQHANRSSSEISRVFRRAIAGTWSLLTPPHGFAVGAVAVVVIALAGAAIVATALRTPDEPVPGAASGATRAVLAAAAIVLAPVCALVFAPQPALLADPLRIFSIGSVPLTIGIVAAASLLPTARVRAAAALAIVVLTACAAEAHRGYWHTRSVEQSHVLGAIVGALPPRLPPAATVTVVDEDAYLSRDVYALPGVLLATALRYVRHDPALDVHVCTLPPHGVAPGINERCTLDGDAVVIGAERVPLAKVHAVDLYRGRHGAEERPVALTQRERRVVPCAASGTCGRGPDGATAVAVPPPG
jgi:hypothetical protein